MQNPSHAIQAYRTASRYRSQRDQEADVFNYAIGVLKAAKEAGPMQKTRALADNRRLWLTVANLLSDPANPLPIGLKAAILSVGTDRAA